MNAYTEELKQEHSNIVVLIDKIVNSVNEKNIDKVEYTNRCIQLKGMRIYEEALRARLANAGVMYESGYYFEQVGMVKPIISFSAYGNDYDKDKEDFYKECKDKEKDEQK